MSSWRDDNSPRKSVETPYMRRDSEYNPEYLDPERLLVRFAPLIESLVRKLRRQFGRYQTEQDVEDLRSEIQAEFLRLHRRYDPARGVDFPGYVQMTLGRRVQYFVQRTSKKTGSELLAFGSEVTNNYAEAMPDEQAEKTLERIEQVSSIPFDQIDNDQIRDIITQILVDGADVHALAEQYQVSPRSMAAKIDAAGRYVRELMQQEHTRRDKEKDSDPEREAENGCENSDDGPNA